MRTSPEVWAACPGVGAAGVALLAYNAMQVGLYGAFGLRRGPDPRLVGVHAFLVVVRARGLAHRGDPGPARRRAQRGVCSP